MMKRMILAGAAAVMTLSAPASAQTAPARPAVLPGETILRVQGVGNAKAPPSNMTIRVGVQTVGATAAEALEANNRKLAPVVDALRDFGVAPADIQTSGFNVQPSYDRSQGRDEERIIGFQAENLVTVTYRDLSRVGDLISLLFEKGANTVDRPSFTLSTEDMQRLDIEAEAAALRNARRKADTAAEALGMRVSRVLMVWNRNVRLGNRSGAITVTGSRLRSTPIEPGEVSVTTTYNVEYALVAK